MEKNNDFKAWRSFAADSKFNGSRPWKEQVRQFRNAEMHLVSGQARLIGIGLVLGLGLLLFGWRLTRGRSQAGRVGLRPLALALALTAGIAATGLIPEWSHASLLAHLPTTLLLALAVAMASSTLLPDTEHTAQRY